MPILAISSLQAEGGGDHADRAHDRAWVGIDLVAGEREQIAAGGGDVLGEDIDLEVLLGGERPDALIDQHRLHGRAAGRIDLDGDGLGAAHGEGLLDGRRGGGERQAGPERRDHADRAAESEHGNDRPALGPSGGKISSSSRSGRDRRGGRSWGLKVQRHCAKSRRGEHHSVPIKIRWAAAFKRLVSASSGAPSGCRNSLLYLRLKVGCSPPLAARFGGRSAAAISEEELMSKLATFVVAVAALVLAFVTLSPSSAEAGWRRGWLLGRARRERLCRTALGLVRPALSLLGAPMPTATLTAIIPIGAGVTGAAGTRHARRQGLTIEGPLPKGAALWLLRASS